MPAGNGPYRPGAPMVAELASGAVVVRGGKVLLLHDHREDRWCLPKGHVDPGESLEEAAIREVREEAGLDGVRLEGELGEVSYRFFSGSRRVNVHKTSVYFLAASSAGAVRTEPIFDRYSWSTFAEALELLRYETDRTTVERARTAHEQLVRSREEG